MDEEGIYEIDDDDRGQKLLETPYMPRNDHQLPPIVRKMPWSTSDMTTSTDCNTARPFTTGCCSGCTKLTKCRLFVVVRVLVVVVVVVV